MSFVLAVAIAASFWTGHGYHIPCHPTAVPLAESPWGNIDAYSAVAGAWPTDGCVIYLSTAAQIERKTAPWDYCAGVLHEAGNIIGIPENTPGLGVTATWFDTPGVCLRWHAWRRAHWRY